MYVDLAQALQEGGVGVAGAVRERWVFCQPSPPAVKTLMLEAQDSNSKIHFISFLLVWPIGVYCQKGTRNLSKRLARGFL